MLCQAQGEAQLRRGEAERLFEQGFWRFALTARIKQQDDRLDVRVLAWRLDEGRRHVRDNGRTAWPRKGDCAGMRAGLVPPGAGDVGDDLLQLLLREAVGRNQLSVDHVERSAKVALRGPVVGDDRAVAAEENRGV